MVKVKCDNCKNGFNKRPSDIKRTKHNFCCRSCSVTFNNLANPKRRIDENITLQEYRDKGKYSTYKSRVCEYARRIFKRKCPTCTECVMCGYERYYEVCHIKPVADFPMTTKLSVVNDIKNLAPLCPTCHWEFDNKVFSKQTLIEAMGSLKYSGS